MKKLFLSTTLLVLTTLAMHASDSTTVRRTVYFDTDISQLTDAARTDLDQLASSLRDAGEYSIYIYGAADVDGGEKYNQQLSERRAQTVRDYLLGHQLKARECASRGLGKQGDQSTKAESRRVDIEIRMMRYASVSELTDALSAGTEQYFTIDPSRAQEVRCKDGTKIQIPAGAFRGADGKPITGSVRISVREALSMADFITQDLSAVSDGRLLESRGMVQVTATADGRPVVLGQPVQVALPAMDARSDMKLFYGQRDSTNAMNWKVSDQPFEKPDPTVSLTLDRATLKRAEIRNRFYPDQPKFADVKAPVEPTLQRAPQAVKKPDDKPMYRATISEKLFHPKKVAVQNKKLYDEAMKKYNDYLARKEAYDRQKQAMAEAQIRYAEQQKAFLSEGLERLTTAREYLRRLYCYHASGEINAKLKELEVLPVTNKTNFAIVTVEHLNAPQNQKEIIRQILGDTYYHYFGFDIENTVMRQLHSEGEMRRGESFSLVGYNTIYDSIYQAHHIYDTLRSMQAQLIRRCADMGILNKTNIDNYVASVNQLGWINCDRFVPSPASQTADISVSEAGEARVFMVFRDMNSFLPLNRKGTVYKTATRIPKGRQVSIVSIRLDHGKPQIAVAKINTSRKDPVSLTYRTCTLDEMRAQFASVNG